MRREMAVLIAVTAFLVLTSVGFATDRLVPVPYSTIQAAIDAAANGDTIIVDQGTYPENINFGGKNITVTSTAPDDWGVVATTTIEGGGSGTTVTFAGTETANCKLAGFTITGGYLDGSGGGIKGNGT